MAKIKDYPVKFTPKGLTNAWDSTEKFPGACLSLQNLIFDQSNPEFVVCRPGVGQPIVDLANLIPGATFISVFANIGGIVYGLVSSSLNPGYDQPFAYNIATAALLPISNITAANVPATQSTSGDWIPPTMAMVGDNIIFTSPGFTGHVATGSFTGAITGSTLTITAPSGVTSLGSNVAGASVPAGTSITGFISGTYGGAGIYSINNTVSSPISAEAMTSASGVFFGILNLGNPAAPIWDATNTGVFPLPSVPIAVTNFNNRAYFACGNASYFSDVLLPTNMATAGQALTHGDATPIVAYGGLPITTTSAGVIGALIVFKQFNIWQVTGDEAITNSLAQNYLSLNIGCLSPRSIVQTPVGMIFIGIDGPYYVSSVGAVLPLTNSAYSLVPDLQQPFQSITTPTRAAAAFTGAIYRVCLSTVVRGVGGTNDYWFDVTNRRWNGPHTFQYDCADQAGNYFLLSSSTQNAKIFGSQYLPELDSVYNDYGAPLSIYLQSSMFPKTPNMNVKQVVESTIELSAQSTVQTYTITAVDDTFSKIGNCTVTLEFPFPTWGNFNWGDSTLWTSPNAQPQTYYTPWTAPLVFKKMAIEISGASSYAMAIGTSFFKYRDCGYTNVIIQPPPALPPVAPVLSAVAGYEETIESWTTVAGASSYNLYWSLVSGTGKAGTEISNATIPYTHTGLSDGTTYYYVVTTVNSTGESPASNEASATPYNQGLFVTVGNSASTSSTPDGIHWTTGTLPSSARWASVTYGKGLYVAVAANTNKAAWSSDGNTWTASTMPSNQAWAVAFGNGVFVAVTAGSNGGATAGYSTDGKTWHASTLSTQSYTAVTYGNGTFVAVAASNVTATSTDGINWQERTLPTPLQLLWQAVCFGNGLFVAVSSNGLGAAAMWSTDGITWTKSTLPVDSNCSGVAYGGGTFVAMQYGSETNAYSTDGKTWAAGSMPAATEWIAVTYAYGLFVAVSEADAIAAYSTDGIHFTDQTTSALVGWVAVTGNQT